MDAIDEYLATLSTVDASMLRHLYDIVHGIVPEAEPGTSYAMPALLVDGKGFMSFMVTKKHYSLYPFCGLERLGLDLSQFEGTKGSLHFTPENPLSDETLHAIVKAKLASLK